MKKKLKEVPYMNFGEQNKIILEEEIEIISEYEKMLKSCSNSSMLGSIVEKNISNFLKRYLPKNVTIETGKFINSEGKKSPQIDILILDSQYPVLCRNKDDSVLAISESVIAAISIKSSIGQREIKEINSWGEKVMAILKKDYKSGFEESWISTLGIFSKIKEETLSKNFESETKNCREMEICILRKNKSSKSGYKLWWECLDLPMNIETNAPLSDFLYELIYQIYSILGNRNQDYQEIWHKVINYFKWGTKRR